MERQTSSVEEKYHKAVERLEALFVADPNAEELAASQKLLGPLQRTLDSQRRIGIPNQRRGLPMYLVVKSLKGSWHADGSWPLIGFDEAEKHKVCDPEVCIVKNMHVSQHRHKDIIHSDAYEMRRKLIPCRPLPKANTFKERNSDAIAAAYEAQDKKKHLFTHS
ncbi:hypothetical protein MPSI1_003673 [Malassezia psittaci]|uniref:Uncharacterized protein n=1 Tax=Malassezia psittaci TaxID=1821823 RepID=A0AAF0JFE3_9BASI|nr:hypothetical protein MPSI1_003673 [Malassezia psittaci]